MTLCVNQSGTWREITTNCVNVSGTWRKIQTGCINQSGTWRCYGFFNIATAPLGTAGEGGYLICRASSVAWIVAPASTEVSRTWYCRNDANTTAQSVSGCTGWFVPTCGQLQNPGYTCRTYWDSYSSSIYWSSTETTSSYAWLVSLYNGTTGILDKTFTNCVRAFRCVSY